MMGLAEKYISKVIVNLLRNIKKPLNKKSTHSVRVCIKKLKALWIIHPIGSSISFKSSFPHLHLFYRKAGKYRNATLVKSYIISTIPDDFLIRRYFKEIKLFKKDLRKLWHSKSFKNHLNKETNHFLSYFNHASGHFLKAYRLQYKLETLYWLENKKDFKKEDLHEARRKLKNIVYQSDSFYSDLLNTMTRDQRKLFLTAGKKIGNWHDVYMALSWIKNIKIDGSRNTLEKIYLICCDKEEKLAREALLFLESAFKASPGRVKSMKKIKI